jgi:phosphoenolpyruvate-protein kinase (PTS system EI component)
MQIIVGRSIQNQIAAGPLHFYHRHSFPVAAVSQLSQEEEIHRFHLAQQRSIVTLSRLYDQAARDVGIQAASIFSIHAMLLEDTSFVESILSILSKQHTTAEYAVQTAGNSFATAFADMDSPYMQARGADIRDISNHLIRCLLDIQPPDPLGDRPAILVSDELLPSEVLALDQRKLLGLITWHGSVDSHTAMLLRAMKIPGLAQVDISPSWDGHPAILDGFSQCLYVDPEPEVFRQLGLHIPRHLQHQEDQAMAAAVD